MAEHKFVYTVSSRTPLSEAQQARVSQAISVAVAQTLAEQPLERERAEFLNVGRIYGGLWIDVERIETQQVQTILREQAAAVGARET